jgi:GAF domain-containing protein
MSPSAIYWINALVSIAVGLSGVTLFVIVLTTGRRERLAQSYALYACSVALVGLGSALANIAFWLGSHGVLPNQGLGSSLFWFELAAAGLYFVGPLLLVFAVTYVETVSSGGAANGSLDSLSMRVAFIAAGSGIVLGIALSPLVISGEVISGLEVNANGALQVELTALGYAGLIVPLLLELLALSLFWKSRHCLGGRALTVSTALLLVGYLAVVLFRGSFPIGGLALGSSILVTGYVVLNYQIFNPLRTLTHRLEATVVEKTRELQLARDRMKRLYEQQLRITQINRDVAQAADLGAMLTLLVDLIHNRLGYHHIYVLQPDEANECLVVKAAAGTTAQTVLERGYRLRIGGDSLAARVAVGRRPTIAGSPADDSVFLGTPALPGARAELAVPLVVGSRTLAVLDVQSTRYEAFSDEDLMLLTKLADLVAVTLDNRGLRERAEKAQTELEAIRQQNVREAWQSAIGGPENAPVYAYTENGGLAPTSLKTAWTPEIAKAMLLGQTFTLNDNGNASTLVLPINLRGQSIGALELQHKQGRRWQPEEIEAVGTVVERLALALETVRLSQASVRRAARERVIRDISDAMQRATDLETLMRVTAQELNRAINGSRTYVRFAAQPLGPPARDATPTREEATHQPSLGDAWAEYVHTTGRDHYETARRKDGALSDSLSPEARQAMQHGAALVLAGNGVEKESHSAIVAPIFLRGSTIGTVGIQDDDATRHWTDDEIAIVEAIAERMALSAENLRLVEESQLRAGRERLTGEVATRFRESLDVDTVLRTAAHQIGQTLQLDDLTIQLVAARDTNSNDNSAGDTD